MSRKKDRLAFVAQLIERWAKDGTLESKQAQRAKRALRKLRRAVGTRDIRSIRRAIDDLARVLIDHD